MTFSLYLLVQSKKNKYFLTEELKKKSVLFFTKTSRNKTFITEEIKGINKYFFTPSSKTKYFISEEIKLKSKYFFTIGSKNKYFITEVLDANPEDNSCLYPKELDRIRNKAILLYYKEVKNSLKDSIFRESYGKISTEGYNLAGNLRLFLDYLSSIWLEKDNDSKSGLVRTSDFYYTNYSINDIIVNFRECGINVKSVVALFNLNSYSIIDGDWPNYFLINNIINPPTEEALKTLKQFTDIYTSESINIDNNQAINSISAAQIYFHLTKELKYLSSFSINGSDYIAYTDYNKTDVTYVPPVFGYTISNTDTVTITYWYEE